MSLIALLRPGMFEFVDEIPLLASGKYRFTISLVEDRGGVGQDQLVAAL